MSKILTITEQQSQKISYWHLAAFLATLPFDIFYNELVLLSFIVHTLIHCRVSYWKKLLNVKVYLIAAIFLLGCITLFYSPDKNEGVNILTRQSAFLIFPVVFCLSDFDWETNQVKLLRVFAITCAVVILYLYADALYTLRYFHLPLSDLFTLAFMNHNFSMPIGIHATYLSMYAAFSIVICTRLLFLEPEKKQRVLYITLIIILAAGLLQLSSRAVFIALLLIINSCFPLFLYPAGKRLRFSIITLFLSFGILLLIFSVDVFKVRYVNELQKDLSGKIALIENNEPRMARWKLIFGLIKKSPATGYGIGAEKKLLKEQYFEHQLYSSYLNEFNTHNEYLSCLLKAGIPGLLLFLVLLFLGLREAFRRKDLLFASLMVLLAVVAVSENVLDLNKGIFFFAFFLSFFLLQGRQKALPAVPGRQPN